MNRPSTPGAGTLLSELANESWQIFVKQIVAFLFAGLLYTLLSVISLGILCPPLAIGFIDMVRAARSGETVQVQDIFGGFEYFGRSLALAALLFFGIVAIAALVPVSAFVIFELSDMDPEAFQKGMFAVVAVNLIVFIPGILLTLAGATFSFQAMAIDDLGPWDALVESIQVVRANLGIVALSLLCIFVVNVVASGLAFAGALTSPLSMIYLTLLYLELTDAPQVQQRTDVGMRPPAVDL